MYINVHYHIPAYLFICYQGKIPLHLLTCIPLDVKLVGLVLLKESSIHVIVPENSFYEYSYLRMKK